MDKQCSFSLNAFRFYHLVLSSFLQCESPVQQKDIESYFQHRENKFYSFSTVQHSYRLFFQEPMYQQNMNPKFYTIRNVKRRPLFCSREEVAKNKRYLFLMYFFLENLLVSYINQRNLGTFQENYLDTHTRFALFRGCSGMTDFNEYWQKCKTFSNPYILIQDFFVEILC